MNAYSFHHALVIRPDDVWIAIVSQFSFYVHANAERLRRAIFVADEGKRDREFSVGSWPPNCGNLCTCISEQLQQNILDADLRDWILPKFSTTTSTDTTITSLLMLATTKKHFERTSRLGEDGYGAEAIAWYHLLIPVLSRVDDPDAIDNHEFWQKVARRESFGSHGAYCSGWCVFTPEGKWHGTCRGHGLPHLSHTTRNPLSHEFWSTYDINPPPDNKYTPHSHSLILDSSPYPRIDCEDIPAGCAELDITITITITTSADSDDSDDDDKTSKSIPCTFLAGPRRHGLLV
ncbi:hypothetical protein R3P38DRAFT_3288118 [Favolaschia claudopus]|uniref:Uncharacterized protein n=1 Tax=Favolaschia claudopus TaxID=2862362 RepID=A0AAV9ZYH1_9AGAR